jgi:hypothetical protein
MTTKNDVSLYSSQFTKHTKYEETPTLLSAVGYGFNAFMEFTKPDINYDILNLQADFRENEARNIQLQVTQEANNLRKQYIKAVGAYSYGTAQRNVKGGEGSAGENIENSARDLGKDIQTQQGNADYLKTQKQMEADRLRLAGESSKNISLWTNISNGFDDIAKMKSAWDLWQREEIKKVDIETKTEKRVMVDGEKPIVEDEKKGGTGLIKDDEIPVVPEEKKPDPEHLHKSDKEANYNLYDNPATDTVFSEKLGAIDKAKVDLLSEDDKKILVLDLNKKYKGNKEKIAKELGKDIVWVNSFIESMSGYADIGVE